MLQKAKVRVVWGLSRLRNAGFALRRACMRPVNAVRESIRREREAARRREPEIYEAREREREESREALRKSGEELRKSWQALPPWPQLIPAFLMFAGLAALIVWVLCH